MRADSHKGEPRAGHEITIEPDGEQVRKYRRKEDESTEQRWLQFEHKPKKLQQEHFAVKDHAGEPDPAGRPG